MNQPARDNLEDLHPTLWRGTQLARAQGQTLDTGYPNLSTQLPGGGWPLGALVEIMIQRPGVGELRLLAPALSAAASRPLVFLQPPQTPNAAGLAYIGIPPNKVLHLPAPKTSDALWAAEQILRAGSCSALLFWQQHVHLASLRRLVLAAKTSETMLFIIRPITCAANPSPAELRLALRPVELGVSIELLKRKGPALAAPLIIELQPQASLLSQRGKASRMPSLCDVAELAPV